MQMDGMQMDGMQMDGMQMDGMQMDDMQMDGMQMDGMGGGTPIMRELQMDGLRMDELQMDHLQMGELQMRGPVAEAAWLAEQRAAEEADAVWEWEAMRAGMPPNTRMTPIPRWQAGQEEDLPTPLERTPEQFGAKAARRRQGYTGSSQIRIPGH